MAEITVKGRLLNIDIIDELEPYDFGYRADWRPDKLIASSPFRDDTRPSFYVHLDGEAAGTWGDSGTGERGGFIALLAALRGETMDATADYLLLKYDHAIDLSKPVELRPLTLDQISKPVILPSNTVTQATSPYLTRRGISGDTQRLFGVGYGQTRKGFVALPWHTATGKLAAVKYRSTTGKDFFYERGATPIADLVYGLDVAIAEKRKFAVIVEAEICALSWWTAGIAAIATGSASISPRQVDLIKRAGFASIALGGDNDRAGRQFNKRLVDLFAGSGAQLYDVDYGAEKDANAVLIRHGVEGLQAVEFNARPTFRMGLA